VTGSCVHTATSSGDSYEDWYLLAPTPDTARSPDFTSCARFIRPIVAVRRPSILCMSCCIWLSVAAEFQVSGFMDDDQGSTPHFLQILALQRCSLPLICQIVCLSSLNIPRILPIFLHASVALKPQIIQYYSCAKAQTEALLRTYQSTSHDLIPSTSLATFTMVSVEPIFCIQQQPTFRPLFNSLSPSILS